MIGGADIVVAGVGATGEGPFIVSLLGESWRDLVVQDASADHAVAPSDASVAQMREFFVYRSRADFESWMQDGASDENGDTMIHVILGRQSTTMVTARAGSQTHGLAAGLRDTVLLHRILVEIDADHVPVRAPEAGSAQRFRELLGDLLLSGGARSELQGEERRRQALRLCWQAMTEAERSDARTGLTHPTPMGLAPDRLELEDRDVEVGERLAPMMPARAAA
jgi:hypothetical protein